MEDKNFDLGSTPENDFDPFASDDDAVDTPEQQPSTPPTPPASKDSKTEPADLENKLPVFEYAGATENIDDASKTFDELRIEKAVDFPELDDGKRVSWTVEYGKITKTVSDPKGISISKMKSDIETSKEFTDSLKKPRADKNPVCKIKPRVTAQSKGQAVSYKGVFTTMDEADAAGKIISIVPARDGKVYEIRNTEIGRFITPVVGCDLLSDIRAGFSDSALPLIPAELLERIITFFRYYMRNGVDKEVLVNIYWDKQSKEFLVDAPMQTVTKASIDSKISESFSNERYIHFMDIHSHNSMKAFFSAVDDADERATRLYTVIGNLHEYFPDVKTRISNGGKYHEIDPGEMFEYVANPFPDEWKDNVHFRESHGDDEHKMPWNLYGDEDV